MSNIPVRKLTICSAFHSPESKRLLELNGQLVRALNPNTPFEWLVADNRPDRTASGLDPNTFGSLEGVPFPVQRPQAMRGSYHLALALNSIKKHIRTRYVLFLDADCYIVRPNWIESVIEYMEDRQLTFFGIPWHPRWYKKVRYFPGPHTLFVDLAKVSREKLDFTPDLPHQQPKPFSFLSKLPLGRARYKFLEGRRGIGMSRDVGFSIVEMYSHQPDIFFETTASAFAPGDAGYPKPGFGRMLDFVLPDSLSYMPKKRGYVVKKHFKNLGFPDVAGLGAEEFFWYDMPFAFHIRGNKSRIGYSKTSFDEQYMNIESAIVSFKELAQI
jgi:glycosyltransferase involved in cell wall biosynthesis